MSNNPAQSTSIYEQLGVHKDTAAHEIHRCFIKLVLKLLRSSPASRQVDEYLTELQRLWFAHDILIDPATRTDYDLRALGIQTGNYEFNDESLLLNASGAQQSSPVSSWRIGELLQAAGVLEQAELDIACDMHKAMPEMQFGRFLSKQGFIGARQLQAVLVGQILLRSGEITLSQFCAMMTEVGQTQRDIKEILLESGQISKSILSKLNTDLS